MKNSLLRFARRFLSVSTRRKIVRLTRMPPVGLVGFGNLRRLKPISSSWGTERGSPVDRYYIEQFLVQNAQDIHGRVLEVGDDTYTRQYGGGRVSQSEVLHVAEQKAKVTIIGDLASGTGIASDAYDCVILTQTLQCIFDVAAALRTVHRILKTGGIALITVPGISKISRYDMDHWGYYWSFTTQSMHRLLETAFPPACVRVQAHGNVLASVAFLHGLAYEELRKKELDYFDPDYELLITARVEKPPQAE